MKIGNGLWCLSVCLIGVLLFGCGQGFGLSRNVMVEVKNLTAKEFVDVRVDGDGYPGAIGAMDAGAVAAMFYTARGVGLEFEVSWRIAASDVVYRKKVTRPANFQLDGHSAIYIEIIEPDQIYAYAKRMPGF